MCIRDSDWDAAWDQLAERIASIAVDHGDTYPAAVADKTGLVDAGGRGLTLAGHMNDGDFVVP